MTDNKKKYKYAEGGKVKDVYDSMTKYQLEKTLKKLTDEFFEIRKSYGTTEHPRQKEIDIEKDKIITLLYGENFSGVGQKYKYADGGKIMNTEIEKYKEDIKKAKANDLIDATMKAKIIEKLEGKIAELEKETPKAEKKEPKAKAPKEPLYTKEECEEIIKKADIKADKAKVSAKKSASKSPVTKDKEKIEKVEGNIMDRVKKGTATKKEILDLIEKAKELIVTLQKALSKLN